MPIVANSISTVFSQIAAVVTTAAARSIGDEMPSAAASINRRLNGGQMHNHRH
jgi:hypothetical protein